MKKIIPRIGRKRSSKTQADYTKDYMERNKVARVVVNFHLADEREAKLYKELKEQPSTRAVVLEALDQLFKNNN